MGDRHRMDGRELNADKRAGLDAALAAVRDGHRVAFGGMTLYRRPVAGALALAAAGRRGLVIVSLTGGLETDLLIGAGCVRRVRSCYVGLEVVGFAPHFTRGVQQSALSRGLILLTCGTSANVVRFLYPLTIPDPQFEAALLTLKEAFEEAVPPVAANALLSG